MVDEAVKDLSGRFDEIYNEEGRKDARPIASIARIIVACGQRRHVH
jgi:hypothetical protein